MPEMGQVPGTLPAMAGSALAKDPWGWQPLSPGAGSYPGI